MVIYDIAWCGSSSAGKPQPEHKQQHKSANLCTPLLDWKHGSYQKHSLGGNCQERHKDGTVQRHCESKTKTQKHCVLIHNLSKLRGVNVSYYNQLENVYLLLSRSHMESGLQGVKVGGSSGILVGSTGGIGQLGWLMSSAGQWSAITAQLCTSLPPGNMQSSAWLLLHVPDDRVTKLLVLDSNVKQMIYQYEH